MVCSNMCIIIITMLKVAREPRFPVCQFPSELARPLTPTSVPGPIICHIHSLHSDFFRISYSQSNAFNAGFNGASQGGLLSQNGFGISQKPTGDLYKPNSGDLYKPNSGLGNFGSSSSGGFSGSPSSSYHSQNPDYYKKELQGGASNQYNGISGGYQGQGQYQSGYDTSRQQIVDCQCVPISQCPAADRIGRKEDLILPIDPRNLGKDIEALSDDALSSNATTTAEAKKDEEKADKDDKKRTRRQADQKDDEASDLSLDAQGVSP